MARSVAEAIQDLLSKPRPTPAPPGSSVSVDPDNPKLPNQRSNVMPSQLYEMLMNQKSPNVYKPATPDYGAAQTQQAIKEAIDVTTSPAAQQKQAQAAAATAEDRRPKGRAATLLTGSQGLLSTPNTSRRSLLGF